MSGAEFGFDEKWLPPSPHREAIGEFLTKGRARIVERGHGKAPLLAFEDGGVIELPRVRYQNTARGMCLVAVDQADAPDLTRHPDVCGSIDEFRAKVQGDLGEAVAARDDLTRLIRDAAHMLGRLQKRRETYETFARELHNVCAAMDQVALPDAASADAPLEELLRRIANASAETFARDGKELIALAERIRDLANQQEKCLAAYKDLAVRAGALYQHIRGGRNWRQGAEEDDIPT